MVEGGRVVGRRGREGGMGEGVGEGLGRAMLSLMERWRGSAVKERWGEMGVRAVICRRGAFWTVQSTVTVTAS